MKVKKIASTIEKIKEAQAALAERRESWGVPPGANPDSYAFALYMGRRYAAASVHAAAALEALSGTRISRPAPSARFGLAEARHHVYAAAEEEAAAVAECDHDLCMPQAVDAIDALVDQVIAGAATD